MKKYDLEFVKQEILEAEKKLIEPDKRAIHLWERIKVTPSVWLNNQYPGFDHSWVVAAMGIRCLYFNHLEKGWGWGQFDQWGEINSYHWQNDEIQHIVFQTLFAIDNGGNG